MSPFDKLSSIAIPSNYIEDIYTHTLTVTVHSTLSYRHQSEITSEITVWSTIYSLPNRLQKTEWLTLSTSIAHPIMDSRSTDLTTMSKRLAGSSWVRSNTSVIPPVKSSIASQLDPPFRLSYEPYILQSIKLLSAAHWVGLMHAVITAGWQLISFMCTVSQKAPTLKR